MTLDQAFELLALPKTATVAQVNRAYRDKAFNVHPDVVGEVGHSPMSTLNAARDLALEHVMMNVEAEPEQGKCPTCDGTKRVKKRKGFTTVEVVCPTCSIE